ncbi:polysaccharide biosynthesis/export family protein [Glaciecola sp. KUL10]|uniref:polysaccharide biosynthesis/export family protein n=1 Tax=Glaciecola sp. (strain KUL10) TaxID=2161813 RepID=UPI000D7888F5|nr:polysaccharide biosynthesis/export family protein [Glaciecola sp. KUL10]GBL04190.1 polysaccharide export protein [Glaciecola sp. KUL10]
MNKVNLVLILVLFPLYSWSQSLSEQNQQAREINQASNLPLENFISSQGTQPRQTASLGGNNFLTSDGVIPFGANLFLPNNASFQRSGVNPEYLIAVGDKISVQLWGAVNLSQIYTVDTQGNIFISSVGPLKVQGLFAKDLNTTITSKIRQVYTDNVEIYVNLLASTPVSIFVTGKVNKPGQYAGNASDSILFFLRQAGGISSDLGSYRNIEVIRSSETVVTIDLYSFLTQGELINHSFQDGDVILVKERSDAITVEKPDTSQRTLFELSNADATGQSITSLAQLSPRISHVAVTGVRNNKPISVYLSMDDFSDFRLQNGDSLIFNDDIKPEVISVKLKGQFLGPSLYTLPDNTTLKTLLEKVEFDEKQADLNSIYIVRESVKKQQKVLLEESLARLERLIFTAPASSDGEARLRAQEAQLVAQFIDRARKVEPKGKVVVSIDGKVSDVRLEQGDEVVIPQFSDLINVSGEVMLPQALVFKPDASISDYVNWAGGYTDRANKNAIVLIHPNGQTSIVNHDHYWFGSGAETKLKPGDQLLITPKADSKLMQTFKDVTQIIFQIAVAANVATN